MVDKIKPLKIESSAGGGTELNFVPTEVDPSEDYISGKGISFEGLDTHLIEKLGRVITGKSPTQYYSPSFNGNQDISTITFYNSSSFVNANRLADVTMAYDGNLDPSSETWKVYDTDGTTVLRTFTITYTFSSNDLSQANVVVT